jgi:hypothetical protein
MAYGEEVGALEAIDLEIFLGLDRRPSPFFAFLPAEALFWRCWPAPPAAGSMAAARLLRFGGIRETEKADWAEPSTGPGLLGSMHFAKEPPE